VGYKVGRLVKDEKWGWNFHLNHVGYKGKINKMQLVVNVFLLSSEPCGI